MERMELSAGVGDQRSYRNSDHRIWGHDGYGSLMQCYCRFLWVLCFCHSTYDHLGELKQSLPHIVRSSVYETLNDEVD